MLFKFLKGGSRGYGLPNRTSFSLFRFDNRDRNTFMIMMGLIIIILIGAFTGQNTIKFFPSIKFTELSFFSIAIYIAYFILCMLPVFINIMEEVKWRHIELEM